MKNFVLTLAIALLLGFGADTAQAQRFGGYHRGRAHHGFHGGYHGHSKFGFRGGYGRYSGYRYGYRPYGSSRYGYRKYGHAHRLGRFNRFGGRRGGIGFRRRGFGRRF